MSELPIRLHPPKISGSDWNNLVTYGLILTGDSWPVDYTSGQIFYRTDLNNFYYYNGALWKEIGFVTGSTINLNNIVADTVEVLDLLTVDGEQVFKDTGNIIVITGSYHWVVPKPGYTPTNNYLYLYATMISPADRTTEITDPVLCTNQAFFVEKDTYTHGFLGTASDPEKAMGGGAVLMGQGFTGRYCPPLFDLTGTIVDMDDPLGGYASGSSFPAAENYAWFYRTDEETLYQYTNTSSTWNSMFTNVKSSEYDTLFLIRADTSGPANLYLNNLNVNTIYPQANSWVTIDEKLLLNGNFQIANGWVVSSLNPSGSGLGIGSPTEQWSGSCVQVMFTDDITALNNAWVDINNKLVVHGNFQITDGWVVSSLNPSGSNLALGSATEQWSGSCVQGMYTDNIHALNNDWVDINNKLVVHGNFQISDGWVVSSLNPSGSGLGIGSPTEQWSGSCIQGIYTDDISALNNSWVDINDKLVVHGDFQISDGWVVSSLNPSGSVGLGSATEKWTGIVATTGYFDAIEMSGSNMTIKYTGSYIGFRNGETRLYSSSNSVLSIQDVSGNLGTLNVSNIFVDHINSASADGIYILDNIRILSTGSWLGFRDNKTRLYSNADGVLKVHTDAGALGTLTVSNVFTDHINSASAGGVYMFDSLRLYDGADGEKLYDATNDSGAEGEVLTVNASGLPVWTTPSSSWNGGFVTNDILISKKDPALRLQESGSNGLFVFISADGTNYIESGLTPDSDSKAPIKFTSMYIGSTWMTIETDGQVTIPTPGADAGILIGGDVHLYRSAANTLTIPNFVNIVPSADDAKLDLRAPSNKDAILNLMCDGDIKAVLGYDSSETKTYLAAYASSGTPSQLHLVGSKIVCENDTDIYAPLNVRGENGFFMFDSSGTQRLSCGYTSLTTLTTLTAPNNHMYITANGQLRLYGSSDVYIWGGKHIVPEAHEGGQVGNSDHRWGRVYSKYVITTGPESGNPYDYLDDLTIMSMWGEKDTSIEKLPKTYDISKEKPKGKDIFDFLRAVDDDGTIDAEGYFDLGKLLNFNMSTSKIIIKKQDEFNDVMLALYDGIETLDEKMVRLEEENNVLKTKLAKMEDLENRILALEKNRIAG